jgi:hypothetical protein
MNDPVVLLERYVNGAILQRSDRIWSAVWSSIPFLRNARQVVATAKGLKQQQDNGQYQSCEIQAYQGKNPYAIEMQAQLLEQLKDDLLEAMVHGSLGTYDETSYSDFDALVIMKDEILTDKNRLVRVARTLHDLRRIMYKMDPLQHHGWFVLTESSLHNFPVLYFPPALFDYAKSLMHPGGCRLEIHYSENHDFIAPFHRLCNSLEGKGYLPKTLYTLKGLLSEFMLLPALYVQARDRKGMYKKFTFEAARPDFAASTWQAMDYVSSIRENWAKWLQEDGLTPGEVHPGTSVPNALKSHFNRDSLDAMRRLVKEAKEKIK